MFAIYVHTLYIRSVYCICIYFDIFFLHKIKERRGAMERKTKEEGEKDVGVEKRNRVERIVIC